MPFLLEVGIAAARQVAAVGQLGAFRVAFGVTLPFNLRVGLPLYWRFANRLAG